VGGISDMVHPKVFLCASQWKMSKFTVSPSSPYVNRLQATDFPDEPCFCLIISYTFQIGMFP
jgi:hypothetical protein